MKKNKISNVEEYLNQFTPLVKEKLQQLRQTIKKIAPNAEEVISYQMPAYRQHGILVFFGLQASHWLLSHTRRYTRF